MNVVGGAGREEARSGVAGLIRADPSAAARLAGVVGHDHVSGHAAAISSRSASGQDRPRIERQAGLAQAPHPGPQRTIPHGPRRLVLQVAAPVTGEAPDAKRAASQRCRPMVR